MTTKVHELVDGHGLPLVIAVTAGQAGDSPMLLPLLADLQVARPIGRARTRPDRVRGDKAYSSRSIRTHLRSRGITAVIPEPSDQQGHRKRRGALGGRPVGYDAIDYKNRNVIERRFCRLKQWRGLATRYDKLATTYRSAVVLNAVIAWTKHLSDTPKCRLRRKGRATLDLTDFDFSLSWPQELFVWEGRRIAALKSNASFTNMVACLFSEASAVQVLKELIKRNQ